MVCVGPLQCILSSKGAFLQMSDQGSSVTLIFYRISPKWWREPALNVVSAVAQMSNLTHCEIALGEESGHDGTMKHVARIFNDNTGVELVERTGKNPQNIYLQLGCSKLAEQRMLHFVKSECIGKPFSNLSMFRSLVWPRQTDNTSFFCAELVAAILRQGGLMDEYSNPGSATPDMLHKIYSSRAAVAANPCVLREVQASSMTFNSTLGMYSGMSDRAAENEALLQSRALGTSVVASPLSIQLAQHSRPIQDGRRRAASPTRGHFKDIGRHKYHHPSGCVARAATSQAGIQLTLNSLDFSSASRMRRA